ncbi:MAG: hypothetical protein C5S41_00390 [Candidatus Methanomarinus sp.]|nr:MAG: hypothetical protein C5S41_00390 [ANME-2 cluster archaeon]
MVVVKYIFKELVTDPLLQVGGITGPEVGL